MVRTRATPEANRLIARTRDMIERFGKTLTLRRQSLTVNDYGEVTDNTTTDYTFSGDLQQGPDIEETLVERGLIQVGEAVLYVVPKDMPATIVMQDLIVETNNDVWQVVDLLETGEYTGTETHLAYRCRKYESDR